MCARNPLVFVCVCVCACVSVFVCVHVHMLYIHIDLPTWKASRFRMLAPVYVTSLVQIHDRTRSHTWHDSFIYATNVKHSYMWHDSSYVWHFRSYVWHDSSEFATRLDFKCSHLYFVTWLVHIRDMTHLYTLHESFIYASWSIHIYMAWLIHMCDMTHSYVSHDSFIFATRLDLECWHSCVRKKKKNSNHSCVTHDLLLCVILRGGGLGSRPKKMYGERLGDGVEYHLMKPTPRR